MPPPCKASVATAGPQVCSKRQLAHQGSCCANTHQRSGLTFRHGSGTDIGCDTAPGLLGIVVTSMQFDAIPGKMPQT